MLYHVLFLQFDYLSIMTIQRKGNFRTSPQEKLQNNHLYDGGYNYLSISRSYSVDFQCTYAMHYYPFDIQKCSMDYVLGVCIIYDNNNLPITYLTIQRTARQYAKLDRGILNYLGNIDLQEYFIVRYDMFDNGPDNGWETQVYPSKAELNFS